MNIYHNYFQFKHMASQYSQTRHLDEFRKVYSVKIGPKNELSITFQNPWIFMRTSNIGLSWVSWVSKSNYWALGFA